MGHYSEETGDRVFGFLIVSGIIFFTGTATGILLMWLYEFLTNKI